MDFNATIRTEPAFKPIPAPLTEEQLRCAAQQMYENGGSFAGHIAKAFFAADKGNKAKLVSAFEDLFRRYA